MSDDCGVCIDLDFEGFSEFFKSAERRARKEHQCSECGDVIPVGQRHEYASGKCEGSLWSARTCLACRDIRDGLNCSSNTTYGGALWEAVDYILPELTTACLSKIPSAAGRQKLLDRWNEWKFSQEI